jgi:hypothetical protein
MQAALQAFFFFSWIEASPRQAAGNLHREDDSLSIVRSLTPPQAAGNALASAVQVQRLQAD